MEVLGEAGRHQTPLKLVFVGTPAADRGGRLITQPFPISHSLNPDTFPPLLVRSANQWFLVSKKSGEVLGFEESFAFLIREADTAALIHYLLSTECDLWSCGSHFVITRHHS